MAIEIETEKVVVNGKRCRKIISIKALSKETLPNEYWHSMDRAVVVFYKSRTSGSAGLLSNIGMFNLIHTYQALSPAFILFEGKIYPEEDFQIILKFIKAAGEHLHEINNNWKGREDFKI